MIYVISDIHGCYAQYCALLEKVHFNNQDTLYVLGDTIDRGPNSMAVLQDMCQRQNVIPLIGDHEYMALQALYHLCPWVKKEVNYPFWRENIQSGITCWLDLDGGKSTYDAFLKLPRSQQISILNYLWSFQLAKRIRVNGETYLLSHGWLSSFAQDPSKHPYQLFEERFQSPDFETLHYPEGILVVGHQPTRFLSGLDEIIVTDQLIALDCGAYLGGKLGLYCLDTKKAYYA